MSEGESKNETEGVNDPSQFSVFVHKADSYIGSHVVAALAEANYTVYGDKQQITQFTAPNYSSIPQFDCVSGIDDAFALCNTFIFDIREDPSVAVNSFSRFEAATTKIKIVLISTLMTWALTVSSNPLTGDDFRKRKPHPNFRAQYEAELKATKLSRENPLVEVYILSCGIPYGDGEDMLFPLMKFAWSDKYTEQVGLKGPVQHLPLIGDGENSVPMIHVRDLASLLVATLQGLMIDKFVMAVDKNTHKLKEIIEAISKQFSDGQVQQISHDRALIVPWMTETLVDYLTADINAINELLARVHMINPNGFVSAIDSVGKEFLDSRLINPLRILIAGPPLSGRSTLAAKISYKYSLPLITVDSVILEAKKNENGYWNQFQTQLGGEITPNLLLDLIKCKLQDIPCRNQGYVLDGVPSNQDFAEALWTDIPATHPHVFIELECSDAFLRDRAKQDPGMLLGIGNVDEFESRLSQYRSTNGFDDSHLFFALDYLTTRSITIHVERCDDVADIAFSFIGRPHNFGKKPSVIMHDAEELERQKRIKQEKLDKMEAQRREAEEAKRRENELTISRQKALIEQEETRLLAKFSSAQRNWLVETIAPALASGLCYLIEEMPDDPIQTLGCYIGETLPTDMKNQLLFEFQDDDEEINEEEQSVIRNDDSH